MCLFVFHYHISLLPAYKCPDGIHSLSVESLMRAEDGTETECLNPTGPSRLSVIIASNEIIKNKYKKIDHCLRLVILGI